MSGYSQLLFIRVSHRIKILHKKFLMDCIPSYCRGQHSPSHAVKIGIRGCIVCDLRCSMYRKSSFRSPLAPVVSSLHPLTHLISLRKLSGSARKLFRPRRRISLTVFSQSRAAAEVQVQATGLLVMFTV